MSDMKVSSTVAQHKKKSKIRAGVALITLSTSRTLNNDQSGDIIKKLLEGDEHEVPIRKLIADNRNVLRATLRELTREKSINVIITTGGTGLAPSDITVETVRGMLEKELPGFNSLFMFLSYPQARSASMLSRAVAGTMKGKLIFCLPGSPQACELAIKSLILPELGHMLMLVKS
jgi:molybdopterin adenylyltransferase